jgi:hypothetical protein
MSLGGLRLGGDGEIWMSTPFPLLVVQRDGRIIAANDAAKARFGLVEQFLDCFHDQALVAVTSLLARDFVGSAERSFISRNGCPVKLQTMTDAKGRRHVLFLDVVADAIGDATRRHECMEHLKELATAVSRDLADPMSVVQGRLELLQMQQVDPPGRHLTKTMENAQRVCDALRNLRVLGRLGPQCVERATFGAICTQALQMVPTDTHGKVTFKGDADLEAAGPADVYARVLAQGIRLRLESSHLVVISIAASGDRLKISVGPSGSVARCGAGEPGPEFHIARLLFNELGGRLEVRRFGVAQCLHLDVPQAGLRRVRARPQSQMLLVVGRNTFHQTVHQLVCRDGYDTQRVPNACSALSRIDGVGGVVAELLLPDWSGLALTEAALLRRPELSGHLVVVSAVAAAPPCDGVSIVKAPPSRTHLLRALGRRVR